MKKWIMLLAITILTSLLVSCSDDNESLDVEDFLQKASELIELDSVTINHIELIETIIVDDQNIYISWQSSHTHIISQTGIVTRPAAHIGDVIVTLIATLAFDGITYEKHLIVTVSAQEIITENKYTVIFDSMGGSHVPIITEIESESTIPQPMSPIKVGYIFIGWFSDELLSNPWNFMSDLVTLDLTLYAKWSHIPIIPTTYKVDFITNSDAQIDSYNNIENNTRILEPNIPTKEGFLFIGWYTDISLTNPWDFNVDKVTSDLVLFAKWQASIVVEMLTVTFITYTADFIDAYQDVTPGSIILEPESLYRDGYDFLGWFTDEHFLNPWNFDYDLILTTLTLYAKWVAIEIEIPEGTAINTPQEFYDIVTKSSAESIYYLAEDLDFTGFSWMMVSYTFTKTLNGNNKTISNLSISGGDSSGIFSKVRTATIYNLNLDNIHITSQGRAGILIGEVDGTDIYIHNISITNSSVSGNNANGVGGLIGKTKPNFSVTIENIRMIGISVINASSAAGSLIGMTEGSLITIQDVYINDSYIQASNRAGGVFGEIKSTVNVMMNRVVMIDLEIKTGQYLGGIIGRNQSDIGVYASDMLINGVFEASSTNIGHLSGDKNIEHVSHVYVVGLSVIGTLNKQSVSDEYIVNSLTTLTLSWWINHLPNIANHHSWSLNENIFILLSTTLSTQHLEVRFVYGFGVQDIVSYTKEGFKATPAIGKEILGYRFIGWYTNNTYNTPYDFNLIVTENLVLYARYEEVPFFIVTVLNEDYIVYENETFIQPQDPSELGKIFDGWYSNGILYDFNQAVTSNLIIIAKWIPAELFTISFNSLGGDTIESVSYFENQYIYQLPYAIKEGYRFASWYLEEELINRFDQGFIDQDYTLYAKYSEMGELIFEETFDYAAQTHLKDTAWTEDKAGQAVITNEQSLRLTELSTEASYSSELDTLVPGRYVLVYDFKQGIGGAAFTIELMNGTQRVFTVGANRSNRYTYRNEDGSETSIAASSYSIVPNEWHKIIVVFDTEHHFYKYFVEYNGQITELTPSGGVGFANILEITSIRIRIVGHGGASSTDPTTYLDSIFIETSSEIEEGKSLFDPEPAINYEDLVEQIYQSLNIPFKDDVRGHLFLTTTMFNVMISWESSNPLVITNDGMVTRDEVDDVIVIMNATFSKGDLTMNKEFEVIVKSLTSDVSFDEVDYSLTGFASNHVSIPILSEGDPGYYVVYNPLDFINAIVAENSLSKKTTAARVIEIRSDLNMGYLEVTNQYGLQPNVFLSHATPLMHPILKQTGISKIVIQDRDGSNSKYHEGLMIFSNSGHTIKHASFSIKRANNIIIRNLKFDELWEWDEKTKGDYDSHDWDYFTIDTVNGLWFDHIELGKAYDGLIDFKAGSTTNASVVNATFSYMKLVFEANAFILAQFDYLEANRGSYGYYNAMRHAGMSKEEIMTVNSYQKKGFLLGGSEFRAGNVFTLTIYNSYIKNLQDRFPRLRGGDVHIFNTIYDATDVYNTRNEVRTLYPMLFAQSIYNRQLTNQALVTTENGSILMENSIIRGVTQVIKSNQVSRDHPLMTGKYLVLNSLYILDDYVFFGSSLDENTAFIRSNDEPILPFSWNIENLPYSNYRLVPVNILEEYLGKSILGATSIPFNWMTIEY